MHTWQCNHNPKPSSTQAFIAPLPALNPPNPSTLRSGHKPIPRPRFKLHCTAGNHAHNNPSIVHPHSDSFPLWIPREASKIQDPYARKMLHNTMYTQIATTLPQTTIATAHCLSDSVSTTDATLVFLHGFDSNMLEYRYMLPIFNELSTIQAHFIDVLGWGLTEKPRCEGFSFGPASKREHLRAFHEQVIGDKRIVLVGASIGSAVAVDYALEYRDRVESLILLDPQIFIDKKASAVMQMFPGMASVGADILRSNWLRNIAVQLSYEDGRFKCADTLRIGGLHCYSEGWKDATVDFVLGDGYCLSERVKEVCVPTLVLWGEKDRVLPRRDRERFPEAIAGSELVIVEDCGHSPHVEKPQFVSGEIVRFLERL